MSYNSTYDLRGKRILNTYQNLLQYNEPSMSFFTGQGAEINLHVAQSDVSITSSYTHYSDSSSFSSWAVSASWAPIDDAPNSISSSWASHSLSSDSSSRSVSSSYLRGSASFTGKATGNSDLEVSGRLIGDIAVQGPIISAAQYLYNNSYVAGNWLIVSSGSVIGNKALIQSQIEVDDSNGLLCDVTGSLLGNAATSTSSSYADRALSASWSPMPTISNSSSWASSSISSSYAVSASWSPSQFDGTASYVNPLVQPAVVMSGSLLQGLLIVGAGVCAHAEGNRTDASGRCSHAEGVLTIASGRGSHAEGNATVAAQSSAHAEGDHTQANNSSSHAEGRATQANGQYSHAEGHNTQANGFVSHTEGYGTTANGQFSHAEGLSTIASGSNQLAIGKYNVQGNDTSLFVVGNGATDGARSDAFQVNQDGVYVNGSITASSLVLSRTADYINTFGNVSYWNYLGSYIVMDATGSDGYQSMNNIFFRSLSDTTGTPDTYVRLSAGKDSALPAGRADGKLAINITNGGGDTTIEQYAFYSTKSVFLVDLEIRSGSVSAYKGFTGSLQGTASNAVSASWAPHSETLSASWASSSISSSYSSYPWYPTGSSLVYAGGNVQIGTIEQDWHTAGTLQIAQDGVSSLYLESQGGTGEAGHIQGEIHFRGRADNGALGQLYETVLIQGTKDPNAGTGSVGGQLKVFVATSGGTSERIRINRDGQIILSGSIINGPEYNTGDVGFFGNLTGSVFGTATNAVSASWAPHSETLSASWASASISSSYVSASYSYINNLSSSTITVNNGAKIGGMSEGITSVDTVQIGATDVGIPLPDASYKRDGAVQIGWGAGQSAITASNAVAIGIQAGTNTKLAGYAIQIGALAGAGTITASNAVQIGPSAGQISIDATNAVQIGNSAGANSTTAIQVVQVGSFAGFNAKTGSYTTFIGSGADTLDATLNVEKSIAIGYNAKVSGSKMAVIGGTGADAVSVGIGTTSPQNTLEVVGNIKATSITASLQGTASWAVSASWAPGGDSTYSVSASWASQSISASVADTLVTGAYLSNPGIYGSLTHNTGDFVIDSTGNAMTLGYFVATASAGLIGFVGTSSYSNTSSYALNAYSTTNVPYTTVATSSTQWITCSFTDQNEYVNLTTGSVIYSFTSSNHPTANNLSDLSIFINNTFTTATASLVFPSQWVNMNGGWPTSITASKNAMIYLRAYGPTQVVGTYLIQP